MKFITHIKKDADVNRIADYVARLPPGAEFQDVIEKIEIVEDV